MTGQQFLLPETPDISQRIKKNLERYLSSQ
jgi:hypothetical protein